MKADTDLPSLDQELAREARRVLVRYVNEVVLELNLCPWARGSLSSEKVRIEPVCGKFFGLADARKAAHEAHLILERARTDERIELVMIPFPRLEMGRVEFDEVLRAVRTLDCETTFALAAFHPEGLPRMSSPNQAVAFLRRSPDPMIQAVRSSVLSSIEPGRGDGTQFVSVDEIASVLQSGPRESLRSRILSANFATLERVGRDRIESMMEEIFRDRATSYAALLGKEPAHGDD